MIKASIDIGTNTILLLVANVEQGRVVQVLEDYVSVVRLGQGVDKNHVFHPEAMDRARKCFRNYAEVLKQYPGIVCRAVATSGSRDAQNSQEFFAEITKSTGITIDIISGEEEALLSFRGSVPDNRQDLSSVAVLDIGGGSTEIVGLEKGAKEQLFRFSFDMGCVRLTERMIQNDPPSEEEITALRKYVRLELEKKNFLFQKVEGRTLIAVAGTATYLASTVLNLKAFDPEKIHGFVLSEKSLAEVTKNLAKKTCAERLGLGGMDKGRADVIISGAIILHEVLKIAKLSSVQVSVRGLRYGAVLD